MLFVVAQNRQYGANRFDESFYNDPVKGLTAVVAGIRAK